MYANKQGPQIVITIVNVDCKEENFREREKKTRDATKGTIFPQKEDDNRKTKQPERRRRKEE